MKTHEVFISDELVAILLKDAAGEGPTPDHKDHLVILLEFFHQGDKVAITAHDHEGVDMASGEGHFQSIQGECDVRSVLVSARRQIPLDHVDGMLRHGTTVICRMFPVAIRNL